MASGSASEQVTFCLSECLSFVLNAQPTCTNGEILCSNLISGLLGRAAALEAWAYVIPFPEEASVEPGLSSLSLPQFTPSLRVGAGNCAARQNLERVAQIQEPQQVSELRTIGV